MTSPKEVHVYPFDEAREHILDDRLCNCMPESKQTTRVEMIVHKRMGRPRSTRRFKAHWVR